MNDCGCVSNQGRFVPNYTGNFDQNWNQTVSGENEYRQQQFPLLTPSQPYPYAQYPYHPYMHYPYHHYHHPYMHYPHHHHYPYMNYTDFTAFQFDKY